MGERDLWFWKGRGAEGRGREEEKMISWKLWNGVELYGMSLRYLF